MDNTISQQAAIKIIKNYCENGCDMAEYNWCPSCQREQFIKLLEALPSEPRWTPCSERLPEENGQYLITVKYKHVNGYDDIYAEHGEWYDGKWDMFCFGHCGEAESILAWMPLPEPYKGV